MQIAIVDADSIYFRAAMSNQKTFEIRSMIDTMMLDIQAQCFSDVTKVAVKGKDNFRHGLYPDYKKNRPDLAPEIRKALNYGHEYMKDKWEGIQADGMEADDLCAIWAYEARELEYPYVICGIDKDLKQIPGNHYNYNKKVHDFVDDDTANLNLMLQCLTGDTADNIPGLKGIGPVKAGKILAGVPMARRWSRVRAAWRRHGAGDPTLSHRLLSMLKSWDELEEIRKECEQKKIVDLTRGKSSSESTVNPSVSTQPTSESEGAT